MRLLAGQSFLQVPETPDKVETEAESTQSLLSPDSTVSISANDWLAGVTERINETMHYGVSYKTCNFLLPYCKLLF